MTRETAEWLRWLLSQTTFTFPADSDELLATAQAADRARRELDELLAAPEVQPA